MAKETVKPAQVVPKQVKPVSTPACTLFGLMKDPVRKSGYECFHIVTATIDENQNIASLVKSEQSWLIWEALHKMERSAEENLIELMHRKVKESK